MSSNITETWVLQAQLTEEPGNWETLPGFTRDTRDELQAVYDRHFARIDGQGCVYRFARVIVTSVITYHEPARQS